VGPKIELVALDHSHSGPNNEAVPYEKAAARVVRWRLRHGKMSQEAFAKLAGVSVGTLQALESARRATRRPLLEKIAKAMDLTYEDLMAGDPEPVQASDPRLSGLLPDDLIVAHMYQRADGNLKVTVKRMLTEYHQRARAAMQSKEALRLPTEATFRERRSGIERRSVAHDSESHERRRAEGE
jgi:transcriptional regulator with XRE-family HTH domain